MCLANVTSEKERSLKPFIAVETFVGGWGDVARSVNTLHVGAQIPSSLEGFFAVGANKGSLSGVRSHVSVKFLFADKSGVTNL